MTIAQQLKAVRDAATMIAWAAEVTATVVIASDSNQVFTFLESKPGTPKAVILYDGEEKRGEHEEAGRVDRNFSVVVSRGQSLDINQDYIADDNAGGYPLYDLVEGCRDAIRGVRFTANETEVYPNFKSISRYEVGDALFDAYKIEFSVGTQLDAAI